MAAGRHRRRRGQGKKLLLAAIALCMAAFYPVKEKLAESAPDNFREGSSLEVHYLDVGQGDATLIRCGEAAMLIDAGNNSKGTQIQAYLEHQGIETLDYVIGTHPDADHIGGLDVVLYKFDCKTVIMPDYEKDTKTYEEVIQTMRQKDYRLTGPEPELSILWERRHFRLLRLLMITEATPTIIPWGSFWSMAITASFSREMRKRILRNRCWQVVLICRQMCSRRRITEAARLIRRNF